MNGFAFLALAAFFRGLYPVVAKLGVTHVGATIALAGANIVWIIYLTPAVWMEFKSRQISIPGVVILILIGSGLVSLIMTKSYYKALEEFPAMVVAIATNCSPIITALIAFLVLKEVPTFKEFIWSFGAMFCLVMLAKSKGAL